MEVKQERKSSQSHLKKWGFLILFENENALLNIIYCICNYQLTINRSLTFISIINDECKISIWLISISRWSSDDRGNWDPPRPSLTAGFVIGDPTPAQIFRSCVQIPERQRHQGSSCILKLRVYIDDWDVPPNTRVLLQSLNPFSETSSLSLDWRWKSNTENKASLTMCSFIGKCFNGLPIPRCILTGIYPRGNRRCFLSVNPFASVIHWGLERHAVELNTGVIDNSHSTDSSFLTWRLTGLNWAPTHKDALRSNSRMHNLHHLRGRGDPNFHDRLYMS